MLGCFPTCAPDAGAAALLVAGSPDATVASELVADVGEVDGSPGGVAEFAASSFVDGPSEPPLEAQADESPTSTRTATERMVMTLIK